VLLLSVLTWGACSSSTRHADAPIPGQQIYGADTSEAAVRAFLDAAAADDYPRMWAVFGTAKGPAVEEFGIAETEARMVVLARLLRNGSYEMRVANLASYGPDRVRYEVRLEGTRKGSVVVPVLTVPDGRARWFVEQLDMGPLTSGSF
jgi:hypothetical protein